MSQLRTVLAGVDCGTFNIDDPASLAGLQVCAQALAGQQGEGAPCGIDQGDGSTVSSSGYCQAGLVCVSDTCAQPAGNGEACDSFEENCDEGLYCGADDVCHALIAQGQACDDDAACATGSCQNGTCAVPDLCSAGG
ncbi:MAG: hypothetical protein R3F60_18220 [bacterium]